ncbi:hypothetical protein [Arthrobacter sp. B2a2-09]|uniref:hypothetical protein n=1 Tax=Arthrobacter sp. B2a2-09 TaxID=2952822 RepID=UPI0022CD23A3|nr:hypothetical protein [Arthrobacter sp. B2a2-09]MCZ9884639.1 hypothetical protein [Arthrobacter sp. B2a2-09]
MRLARKGVKEVGQKEGLDVPSVIRSRVTAHERGLGREVRDEDGETTERELAAPVVREVDAIEAEEVSFYGVGRLTEKGDERR